MQACSSTPPFPLSPDRSLSRNCAVVRFSRMLIVSSSFLYWFIRSGGPGAMEQGAMPDVRAGRTVAEQRRRNAPLKTEISRHVDGVMCTVLGVNVGAWMARLPSCGCFDDMGDVRDGRAAQRGTVMTPSRVRRGMRALSAPDVVGSACAQEEEAGVTALRQVPHETVISIPAFYHRRVPG